MSVIAAASLQMLVDPETQCNYHVVLPKCVFVVVAKVPQGASNNRYVTSMLLFLFLFHNGLTTDPCRGKTHVLWESASLSVESHIDVHATYNSTASKQTSDACGRTSHDHYEHNDHSAAPCMPLKSEDASRRCALPGELQLLHIA
jgi:hypothetical protein